MGTRDTRRGGRAKRPPCRADKQTVENGHDARDGEGRFAEGNPGGPGRPQGTPNKVNATLREDILDAYNEKGGIAWLRKLPDREFVRLIQRVMPKQIAADVTMTAGGALGLDLTGMSEAELLRLAQAVAVERDDLKDYSDEDLATLSAWMAEEVRRRAESRNGAGAPGPGRKAAPSSPAGSRTATP